MIFVSVCGMGFYKVYGSVPFETYQVEVDVGNLHSELSVCLADCVKTHVSSVSRYPHKTKTVGLWPTAGMETKKELAKGRLAGKIYVFWYIFPVVWKQKKERI